MAACLNEIRSLQRLGCVLGHDKVLKTRKDGTLDTRSEAVALAFRNMFEELRDVLEDVVRPVDDGQCVHGCQCRGLLRSMAALHSR